MEEKGLRISYVIRMTGGARDSVRIRLFAGRSHGSMGGMQCSNDFMTFSPVGFQLWEVRMGYLERTA